MPAKSDQGDLFPATSQKKGRQTRAPDELAPPQILRLEEWAERVVPWVSRGALGSYGGLHDMIDECLEWWRGSGGTKANWVGTIQNRIRTVERDRERGRVTKMAAAGSEDAKLALRDPAAWAARYDVKAKEVARMTASTGTSTELLRPEGGTALRLIKPGSPF